MFYYKLTSLEKKLNDTETELGVPCCHHFCYLSMIYRL